MYTLFLDDLFLDRMVEDVGLETFRYHQSDRHVTVFSFDSRVWTTCQQSFFAYIVNFIILPHLLTDSTDRSFQSLFRYAFKSRTQLSTSCAFEFGPSGVAVLPPLA